MDTPSSAASSPIFMPPLILASKGLPPAAVLTPGRRITNEVAEREFPETVQAVGAGGEFCHCHRSDGFERTVSIGNHRTAWVRYYAADGGVDTLPRTPEWHKQTQH